MTEIKVRLSKDMIFNNEISQKRKILSFFQDFDAWKEKNNVLIAEASIFLKLLIEKLTAETKPIVTHRKMSGNSVLNKAAGIISNARCIKFLEQRSNSKFFQSNTFLKVLIFQLRL